MIKQVMREKTLETAQKLNDALLRGDFDAMRPILVADGFNMSSVPVDITALKDNPLAQELWMEENILDREPGAYEWEMVEALNDYSPVELRVQLPEEYKRHKPETAEEYYLEMILDMPDKLVRAIRQKDADELEFLLNFCGYRLEWDMDNDHGELGRLEPDPPDVS